MHPDRLADALAYAAHAHAGQLRKGTQIPYVSHLLAVCALVLEDGGSEDEAIAALLHDVAEDQGGEERLADVRERFGEGVAAIVAACSDTFASPKPEWRQRKQAYVAALEPKPKPVLRVAAADKLHNARAMLADWRERGDAFFVRFNAGKDDQLWYYRALADVFARRLPQSRLTRELVEVVTELQRGWAGSSTAEWPAA
jgi:(p)ppGpp synthase/HD superfamily hydrolase